jgi:hypothetical protein
MAWTAANCTDEVLVGLLKAVQEFGIERIAQREIPEALHIIDKASSHNIQSEWKRAADLCKFAVEREIGALLSVEDIFTGSETAKQLLSNRLEFWITYRESLRKYITKCSQHKASQLDAAELHEHRPDDQEKKYAQIFPSLHSDVRGKEFSLERSSLYRNYIKDDPLALNKVGLGRAQQRAILNYINGKRSISQIRMCVTAETGRILSFKKLAAYLKILEEIGWINL